MQATHKSIGYAYPTSDIATKFGKAKEGCYFVALHPERHAPGKAIVSAGSLAEAEAIAERYNLPTHPFCFTMYPRN